MISVIICSIDEQKYRRVTENYARLLEGEQYEIIGIHDARSLSEGYNRGVRKSTGSILVFSHDDIELFSSDLASKLKSRLERYDVVGVAGTTLLLEGNWGAAGHPFIHGQVAHGEPGRQDCHITVFGNKSKVVENVQALDGLFIALRRAVAARIPFDERTFDGFHLYDLDFTFSAHLAGFRLAICNDIAILHHSRGTFDEKWKMYKERFDAKFASQLQAKLQEHQRIYAYVARNREELVAYWTRYEHQTSPG